MEEAVTFVPRNRADLDSLACNCGHQECAATGPLWFSAAEEQSGLVRVVYYRGLLGLCHPDTGEVFSVIAVSPNVQRPTDIGELVDAGLDAAEAFDDYDEQEAELDALWASDEEDDDDDD